MVADWTDKMTARERVETIATTLEDPRTANWVAEQAEVKWDTAKKHLDTLVDAGTVITTTDDKYVADPTRAYFDTLRDLILNNSQEELRGELTAIAERIDEWKTRYNVESIDELEATLADDRDSAAIRERHQSLRRWENTLRTRETIQTALRLYDDVESLTAQSHESVMEGTG
jgi:predicted ArsR family transcriptional regulator